MNGRRIILAIAVVVIVIILSILIFSVDWGGGDDSVDPDTPQVTITDYADTNTRVRMTIRGEINSNEEHEELQITVGRARAVGAVLSGYQGQAKNSTQTGNNEQSYQAFLSALHNASFTKEKIAPITVQYDGVCPTGKRYTFEFIDGGENQPNSTWTTSCSKRLGTFDGDLSLVRKLFYAQIPDEQFKSLVEDSQF